MSTKKMNLGSKDLINSLPDCLISHILSFVPTKEAASTSLLAKRWRYLFALTPNLDFDDSIYVNQEIAKKKKNIVSWITKKKSKISKSFVEFVDRVLALHKNVPLTRFSLKCEDVVHPSIVIGWILKVLDHGVLDLNLQISMDLDCPLPLEMFRSETLVKLKIGMCDVLTIDVKDVYLPKVKTLCLDYVIIKNSVFAKLLSGCYALEELVLNNLLWEFLRSCSVSNRTVKSLKFYRPKTFDETHKKVSFDTPSLVYLEYSDTIAYKYGKVNFSSLVEASLNLRMTYSQLRKAKFSIDDSPEMVGNATDFLMGICNVKILYLSDNTLEVLTYCCNPMPEFNNLVRLTIKTSPEVAWESLPALLNNCPNLETLVFEGLHHNFTYRDKFDGFVYKLWEEITTCLSSSPMKVLKILDFGEIYGDNDIEEQMDQVKQFLAIMPNLEQLILYYDTSFDEDVNEVASQLQWHPRVSSSKCKIQVISDNFSLSSMVPSSVTSKWGCLFQ